MANSCLRWFPSISPEKPHMQILNIAADPRVCRGSIFAARREEQLRQQHRVQADATEAAYRYGVLRARLGQSLPPVSHSLTLPRNRSRCVPSEYRLPCRYARESSTTKGSPPVQHATIRMAHNGVHSSIDKSFNRVRFLPRVQSGNGERNGMAKSTKVAGARKVEPTTSEEKRNGLMKVIPLSLTPPPTAYCAAFNHVHVQTDDVSKQWHTK